MLEVAGDMDAAVTEGLRSEAREQRSTLVARFDASSRARGAKSVEMAFAPAKLHFFDLETGLGIYG